jgi:hypothetical protein
VGLLDSDSGHNYYVRPPPMFLIALLKVGSCFSGQSNQLAAILCNEARVEAGGKTGITVKKIMKDVFFLREPAALEMCLLAQRCNWDTKDPDFKYLREVVWQTNGSHGNTKFSLEDTFGVLRDKRRQNKNKKMNRLPGVTNLSRHPPFGPNDFV